jgi:hypothetical protein
MSGYWLHSAQMAGPGWPVQHQWAVLGQTCSEVWAQISMMTPGLRDMKNLGLLFDCQMVDRTSRQHRPYLRYLRLRRSFAASASRPQKGHQVVVQHPCSKLAVAVGHSGRCCSGRVAQAREARGCSVPSEGPGSGVPLRAEMGLGRRLL